jgi:hypothetical protein
VKLAELRDERWVQGTGPDSPRLVERICRSAGFEPRVVAEGDATQTLVAIGIGVTLVPAMARARLRGDLVVTEVAERPSRDVFALARRDAASPATQPLLDSLAEAASHARDVWGRGKERI